MLMFLMMVGMGNGFLLENFIKVVVLIEVILFFWFRVI